MKKIIAGFKFGMVPQLIIGPVCLLVFHTSENNGFFFTIPLIILVAIVDLLYISCACLGVQKLLEGKKKKAKIIIQIIGAVILILFGINTILNVFDISVLPVFSITPNTQSILLKGFIIAITNPIALIFWGSVLTTKFIEDKMKKKEQILFCLGIILSTLFFQSFVALLGSTISHLISNNIRIILNIGIGIYMIIFGFQRLRNKPIKTNNNRSRSKKNENKK